jgi:hypothetical protein
MKNASHVVQTCGLSLQRSTRVMAKSNYVHRSFGAFFTAVLLLSVVALSSNAAFGQFKGPTQLTLVNGWTDAGFTTSHAMAEVVSGIVQFRGSIESGTSGVAFTLPAGFAPAATAYVPVDLCNANKGRLIIQPSGVVSVQAEKTFSDAQCFTSLDGASFALNATGFTSLPLINGWVGAPFATSAPAVKNLNGVVHFKGAIATSGTNAQPFVLPTAFRPATNVYVEVDLCNANKGRLLIQNTGVVTVQAESGTPFSNAQCFTSLDGAWFMKTPNGAKALTLLNGWTNAPFATSSALFERIYNIVYFKGAIGSGTSTTMFTLPIGSRPVTNIFIPIDLCNANKGRLLIQTSGAVSVQAESSFSDAQCFTSLDGASFQQ